MPEQFFPAVLQAQDSSEIWGWDPVLVMVMSFIVVPIALAVLVLTLGALGRLLRGDGSCQSPTRLPENRFRVVRQLHTDTRLERRRYLAPQLRVNTVCEVRRGHR